MSPAAIHNMNDLLAALQQLTKNDSKAIKKAEKMLKAFLKTPSNAPFLIVVLRNTASEAAIRHHAALLLKKKIDSFYPSYSAQQQQELKAELLQLLVNEPEAVVATALAGVVAVVAKVVFDKKQQWEELFSLLMTLTSDPNEKHRALSFNLLAQLAEHTADNLRSHTGTIAQMFAAGCQDADSRVSSAALEGINAYIGSLGGVPEVTAFGMVLPHMLRVLEARIKSGDEDIVIKGLDVLQEMATLEQPLVNDYVEHIVQFCVTVIRTAELEPSLKRSAGQTLMDVIEYRPKLFAKKNLVNVTLLSMMEAIAQDRSSAAGSLFAMPMPHNNAGDEDDEDDDEDEDELSMQKLAQTVIDNMAIHIPSKYFVDTALTLCSQGVSSPDPHMRKAGCAVLGVIAEGCSDTIRTSLQQIVPVLLGAVRDAEPIVRECACFAMGQFSEHCQPEILHYNHLVLPAMFEALDDIHTVQCTACYVLEYFCEGLQPATLRPYLRQLLEKIVNLLRSDKVQVKEMALSALAATAVAAEADFVPYTDAVCAMLEPLLHVTEPSQFNLRGRALECWGHIAVGVGYEHFAKHFASGMQSAMMGAKIDDLTLPEHCFVFVANGAKCMGENFNFNGVNYMQDLVPYILETVQESEIIEMVDEDDDDDDEPHEAHTGTAAAGGAAAADEDDEEDDGDYRINVEEGFVNTKKAALTALGALAEHTKQLFFPYLPSTLAVLVSDEHQVLTSVHENIRGEGINILQHYVQSILAAKGVVAKPARGVAVPLDGEAGAMLTQILTQVLTVLFEDDAKFTVAQACECLSGILEALGVTALQLTVSLSMDPERDEAETSNNALFFALRALQLLLTGQALCQKMAPDSHDHHAGEEDESDHDNVLMDSVTDLLSRISQTLPANVFQQYFGEFFAHLQAFLKPTRSASDRSMALGCVAEIFKDLEAYTLQYLPAMMPILQANLADPLESVRRNAAFCVHVTVEACGLQLAEHHLTLLQWLHPLCMRASASGAPAQGVDVHATSSLLHHDNLSTVDSHGADVDNALSAVCKMIQINPALPLGSIVPVIINALPLRGDNTEGPNVYRTLCGLLTSGHAVLGDKVNVQTCNQFLFLNNINIHSLQIANNELPVLLALVAVLVQAVSANSNALDETKAIVLSALKEVLHNPALAAAKAGLETFLGALNDQEFRQQLAAQLL